MIHVYEGCKAEVQHWSKGLQAMVSVDAANMQAGAPTCLHVHSFYGTELIKQPLNVLRFFVIVKVSTVYLRNQTTQAKRTE